MNAIWQPCSRPLTRDIIIVHYFVLQLMFSFNAMAAVLEV